MSNNNNSYYNQGAESAKPVILTGTGNFKNNNTVTIPTGLTYVCAGITSTDCWVYNDDERRAYDTWVVATSWSYNADTGVVSFNFGPGVSWYLGSECTFTYQIMYVE